VDNITFSESRVILNLRSASRSGSKQDQNQSHQIEPSKFITTATSTIAKTDAYGRNNGVSALEEEGALPSSVLPQRSRSDDGPTMANLTRLVGLGTGECGVYISEEIHDGILRA
jgi:hypothetical protein